MMDFSDARMDPAQIYRYNSNSAVIKPGEMFLLAIVSHKLRNT